MEATKDGKQPTCCTVGCDNPGEVYLAVSDCWLCKRCDEYDGPDDIDYDAPSAQERAESSYRDKYYGGRW